MAQQVKNPTSIHEDWGSISGPTQQVKGSGVAVSCGVGRRHGLALVLLWPWLRSGVAVVLIQAGSFGSDWTPILGISICCGHSPKKRKKKKVQGPSCCGRASIPRHPNQCFVLLGESSH